MADQRLWVPGVEGQTTDWRAVANELIDRLYRDNRGTAIVDDVVAVVRKHSTPARPHDPAHVHVVLGEPRHIRPEDIAPPYHEETEPGVEANWPEPAPTSAPEPRK